MTDPSVESTPEARPVDAPDAPLGPGLFLTALALGPVVGLLELLVETTAHAVDGRVTIEAIRTNRHHLWMVPVSDLMLIAILGAVLHLVAGRHRIARAGAMFLLLAAGAAAVLMAVPGLYTIARVVLIAGIAAQLTPYFLRSARLGSILRRLVLPAGLATVAGLVVVEAARVTLAERRAYSALPQPRRGAPNVVLMVLDTVRADHTSLHGYERPTTPNLARWAARGVRFDQARSPAPWTLPSHASMLTGCWPHELSAAADRALDGAKATLAEHLASRGYATGGFVANTFYCNACYGLDRGFARYEDFPDNARVSTGEILRSSRLGHRLVRLAGVEEETPGGPDSRKSAARINADMLGWLDRQPAERPFFAFLNYYDAHAPFEPPADYRRQFGLSARDAAWRKATLKLFRNQLRPGERAKHHAAEIERVKRDGPALLLDSYDDCIAYIDREIGRLMNELEHRGILNNTLVIITSDHGEHFGDHQLFGHGHSLYRPLVHVPLVILPPGGEGAGRIVTEPVSLRDLSATIVDLLGESTKSPLPGTSLAATWGRGTSVRDEGVLTHVEHQRKISPNPNIPASNGPVWSYVDRNGTYIRHRDGREELYDLLNDPAEIRNLVPGMPQDRLRRYRDGLDVMIGRRDDGRTLR